MTEQQYLIREFGTCCMSQALQSNCQGYYRLWDICIFTRQQFAANKYCEIKFGLMNVFSENKVRSITQDKELESNCPDQ